MMPKRSAKWRLASFCRTRAAGRRRSARGRFAPHRAATAMQNTAPCTIVQGGTSHQPRALDEIAKNIFTHFNNFYDTFPISSKVR